jgi:hypothetical protein
MVFFGTLAVVVVISSVVLIGQYLRGDLAEHRRADARPTPLHSSAQADRHRAA